MSNINLYDIQDNEIRIVGQVLPFDEVPEEQKTPRKDRKWMRWILSALALLILGAILLVFTRERAREDRDSIYQQAQAQDTLQSDFLIELAPLSDGNIYTQISQRSVDDIPLRLLIPTGGHIDLIVGMLPTDDPSIVLAAQAADYRADNGRIAGAFVYRGELLSRGHPKLGFCAIIGNGVTMGMSPETPLFERAVEQSGYFFRQFSLVHNGGQGESTPPGKSVRRALCYDGERLFIAETEERESLHDFAQALIGIGVQEAISLVGSIDLPLYEDEQGNRIINELPHMENATESYIVWRR